MHLINISLLGILCALSVQAEPPTLPPLPRGVTELKFAEFFAKPVGPLGLTFTDKLTSLDGKRVRLVGYMVEQDKGVPGVFLFSALPVQLHDHDSALADDLPAAVVHVTVPTCRDRQVPHARGMMLLTGTLNIGPRNEPDGRTSVVRLALDPPEAFATKRRPAASPKSSQRHSSLQTTHK
jgi:hypothetical protein